MRLSKEHFALLPKDESYVGFLEHLFTRRQVLFIGYSFLDPAIKTVLSSVRARTHSMHAQEHWAFVPNNASSDFISELNVHSIRVVKYDPKTIMKSFGLVLLHLQLSAKLRVVNLPM